jgi:hypothetical protein
MTFLFGYVATGQRASFLAADNRVSGAHAGSLADKVVLVGERYGVGVFGIGALMKEVHALRPSTADTSAELARRIATKLPSAATIAYAELDAELLSRRPTDRAAVESQYTANVCILDGHALSLTTYMFGTVFPPAPFYEPKEIIEEPTDQIVLINPRTSDPPRRVGKAWLDNPRSEAARLISRLPRLVPPVGALGASVFFRDGNALFTSCVDLAPAASR